MGWTQSRTVIVSGSCFGCNHFIQVPFMFVGHGTKGAGKRRGVTKENY